MKQNKTILIGLVCIVIILFSTNLIFAGGGEVRVATTGKTVKWIKSWASDFEKETGIKLIAVSQWISGAKLKYVRYQIVNFIERRTVKKKGSASTFQTIIE